MDEQVTWASVEQARRWLETDQVVIVDVRERHEYQAAHIPGATLLPLSEFDPASLPAVPAGKHLLLHCRSARRCGPAAQSLVASGYTGQIHRLSGGVLAWIEAGAPVESA